MKLSRLTLVPLSLLLAACGGSDPVTFTDPDGGSTDDGAVVVDDAGNPITPDGGTKDSGTPVVSGTPFVENLTITEVAVFQTVKIGLMKTGAPVVAKPPVVADRAALVRVYVAPGAGYSPHAIQAQLVLQSGSTKTTYPVEVTVGQPMPLPHERQGCGALHLLGTGREHCPRERVVDGVVQADRDTSDGV
jgi:hypothetical protein